MQKIASALVALAIAVSFVTPASAGGCSLDLSKGGAKAYFACMARERQ